MFFGVQPMPVKAYGGRRLTLAGQRCDPASVGGNPRIQIPKTPLSLRDDLPDEYW